MKSIKQTVETSFTCIEISDAIVIVPIMDALTVAIEEQETIKIGNCEVPAEFALRMYKTLRNVGFCNSMGKDPEVATRLCEDKNGADNDIDLYRQ